MEDLKNQKTEKIGEIQKGRRRLEQRSEACFPITIGESRKFGRSTPVKFQPFLLDQWLQSHAEPPIEFDLAASTGPHWTLQELLQLTGEEAPTGWLELELTYSRAEGMTRLREAIAEMQGVPVDEVLVTAGASEALFHAFFLAAEPGANVVVPFPCFPPNQSVPEALGLEVRSYRLRHQNAWRVDPEEIAALADSHTKLILVNSPHNPTGATVADAEMRWLHDFAARKGIQLISDEVYHPIYHGEPTASAAALPHATVIGDFSKAFSLGGLRLGWIIERDRIRRKMYVNAREHLTITNVPAAEYLADIAIRHRDRILSRTSEVAARNLAIVGQVLAEQAEIMEWVRPRGGMTGFPRLKSGEDSRAFCQAAARHGMLLAPGDCFGMPDHFRLGFGVSEEWFSRAMQRFAQFSHEWSHTRQAM